MQQGQPRRSSNTWKIVIAAIVGATLVAICAIVAVTSISPGGATPTAVAGVQATATAGGTPVATPQPETPTPPGAAEVCTVGQRCERGGIALTVNEVSTSNRTDGFGRTAEPGRTFLVLNVTIENVSRDEAPYNPFYFRVRAQTGEEFPSLVGEAPSPSLVSGTLARGERVRGNVAFEISEGQRD